jgi:hypothetical protein
MKRLEGGTFQRPLIAGKIGHPECIRTYRQQERRDKADQAQLKAAFRRHIQT